MAKQIPELLCPNCRRVAPHKIIAVDRSMSLAWCENCWVPHGLPERIGERGPLDDAGIPEPLSPGASHKYAWFAARRS